MSLYLFFPSERVILLPPEVRSAFLKFGDPREAKVTWKPKNSVPVNIDTAKTLMKLIETPENNDDVQSVVANYELPEGFMS